MFSIPNIKKKDAQIKMIGKISKFHQEIIKEIINITLYKERINNEKLYIEVIIATKEESAKYNKEYLNKEGPADIISIKNEENKEKIKTSNTILGTIILCPAIIKENSEDQKIEYLKHLAHLSVHGTLHLLGYDHQEEEERKQMENKEINVLTYIGIPSPYL